MKVTGLKIGHTNIKKYTTACGLFGLHQCSLVIIIMYITCGYLLEWNMCFCFYLDTSIYVSTIKTSP